MGDIPYHRGISNYCSDKCEKNDMKPIKIEEEG